MRSWKRRANQGRPPLGYKTVVGKSIEKSIKKFWPVFVLPTLAAFIIGFIWPFLWGIGLSFCKFTTVKNVEFVGLRQLFQDLAG